jgi:DUF4097 and DUF4098 domain-containing protein YvlB
MLLAVAALAALQISAAVAAPPPVPDLPSMPPSVNNDTRTSTISQEIDKVVVTNDAGSVKVRPGAPTKVVAARHWSVAEPTVAISVQDRVLTIDSECPDIALNDCRVELTLWLPKEIELDAHVSAGSIDVANLIGDEALETSAGSITVTNVTANWIEAASSAGSVDLIRVNATHIYASSSSGSVDVDDVRMPKLLTAETSAGSVDVAVPAGTYAISARSNAGSARIRGLTNNPSAPNKIVARTSSGSVDVHARS